MAVNLKRLVYFDSFMDPIANAIISKRDDIDLVRLEYDTPESDNWERDHPGARLSDPAARRAARTLVR